MLYGGKYKLLFCSERFFLHLAKWGIEMHLSLKSHCLNLSNRRQLPVLITYKVIIQLVFLC